MAQSCWLLRRALLRSQDSLQGSGDDLLLLTTKCFILQEEGLQRGQGSSWTRRLVEQHHGPVDLGLTHTSTVNISPAVAAVELLEGGQRHRRETLLKTRSLCVGR